MGLWVTDVWEIRHLMGLWVTDVWEIRHVMGLWVTDVWEQTSRDGAVGH